MIAAAVIAFPLMYRNARAAFEQVDVNLIYAGRTLGMSEGRIFWKVIMPAAGPGMLLVQCLLLHVLLENTEQLPCLQEISWARRERFL